MNQLHTFALDAQPLSDLTGDPMICFSDSSKVSQSTCKLMSLVGLYAHW